MGNPRTPDLIRDPVVAQRLDYWAKHYARAFHLTPDDYADLRQDLLVALLTQLPSFDPTRGSLRTFVNIVLDTAGKQAMRVLSARRRREVGVGVEEDDAEACDASCPLATALIEEAGFARAEWHVTVHDAVAVVAPELWPVMVLRMQGWSTPQIAAALGIHRNTVLKYVRRLRQLLSDEDPSQHSRGCRVQNTAQSQTRTLGDLQ